MLWERSTQEVLPIGAGGVPGRRAIGSGVDSGVCCLGRLGGGTPVPLYLRCVGVKAYAHVWPHWKAYQ
jgi:hypothetical protein